MGQSLFDWKGSRFELFEHSVVLTDVKYWVDNYEDLIDKCFIAQ